MKWIASFGGELNNAAHYFSTFANVCDSDKDKMGREGDNWDWPPRYMEAMAL
jgi:hypothetical protein